MTLGQTTFNAVGGYLSSLIVLMSGCTRFSCARRSGEKSDKVTIYIDFEPVLRLSYG